MSAPGYIARVDRAAVVMHGQFFQFIRKSHAERRLRVPRLVPYGPPKPRSVTPRKRGRPPSPKGLLDHERATEFSRRYLAGETYEAIAKDHGISRERVRQILRKFGVPSLGQRARKPAPLTQAEQEIVRLYDQGISPQEICARLGVSGSAIVNARKRAGVKAKGAGFYLKRPDDAQLTAEVASLYAAGLSAPEIVSRLPQLRFPETVYRYLKKAGVPPRNKVVRKVGNSRTARANLHVDILAAHGLGLTTKQICAQLEICPAAVYRHLALEGLGPNRRGRKGRPAKVPGVPRKKPEAVKIPARDWSDDELTTLRDRWQAGDSASGIGRALNRSRNAILGKIHRMGINHSRTEPPSGAEPGIMLAKDVAPGSLHGGR